MALDSLTLTTERTECTEAKPSGFLGGLGDLGGCSETETYRFYIPAKTARAHSPATVM
jgi:hypothetical protein